MADRTIFPATVYQNLTLTAQSGTLSSMNKGRQYQIGERISCACGAAYEFGVEGRCIVKKRTTRAVGTV